MQLSPYNVFHYFYEISKIPRGSGNTKAISDYCKEFAVKHNLWYKQDSLNNIIIKKEASSGYENRPAVIIQGHLDMVCEKTSESNINFKTDGLSLKIKDDFIYAENTTLGADDGIAVAYALALLESDDIQHPPLEIILTSDEETGMDGAINLDFSDIDGRLLLNIDSENEGVFTVSCAGGICCEGHFPFKCNTVTANAVKIKIHGLLGGHSGVEIGKNRTNANIAAGELLSQLLKIPDVKLSKINGGKKHNAIPNECDIVITYENSGENIIEVINAFSQKYKNKLHITEPDFKISYNRFYDMQLNEITKETSQNLADFLCSIPDGVNSMSKDIDGLVETSSNLGILKTEENGIYFLSSIRSSKEEKSNDLLKKISALCKTYGAKTHSFGYYPAWEYREKSYLRNVMCSVYKKQYKKQPVIEAIHAGLECGIFCGKAHDLDCVSFGPDILDIHTVKERMSISSVQRVWEFIKEVLASI